MKTWGCPNCETDNSVRSSVCIQCGEDRPGGARVAAVAHPRPEDRAVEDAQRSRLETFQPCPHVAIGTLEPCSPCRDEIARLRAEFLAHGERITARTQPISDEDPGEARRRLLRQQADAILSHPGSLGRK